MYHLSWYYKYIVDHPELVEFLSKEQQSHFQSLLKQNFTYIDIDAIEAFDLSGIDDFIKQGWATFYKKQPLPYQKIYVRKQKKKLQLCYYASSPRSLYIQIDNIIIEIPKTIVQEHTFLDEAFINKYLFEIPLTSHMKTISIQIDSLPTYLKTFNNEYLNKMELKNIQSNTMNNVKQLVYNVGRRIVLGK